MERGSGEPSGSEVLRMLASGRSRAQVVEGVRHHLGRFDDDELDRLLVSARQALSHQELSGPGRARLLRSPLQPPARISLTPDDVEDLRGAAISTLEDLLRRTPRLELELPESSAALQYASVALSDLEIRAEHVRLARDDRFIDSKLSQQDAERMVDWLVYVGQRSFEQVIGSWERATASIDDHGSNLDADTLGQFLARRDRLREGLAVVAEPPKALYDRVAQADRNYRNATLAADDAALGRVEWRPLPWWWCLVPAADWTWPHGFLDALHGRRRSLS